MAIFKHYILCLPARADCVSNPVRRKIHPAFCLRPARDGKGPKPESGSRRTRRRPPGRPWVCQSPARFRRSFSFCHRKFSAMRSRRVSEIPFRRINRVAAGYSPLVRRGCCSGRLQWLGASGKWHRQGRHFVSRLARTLAPPLGNPVQRGLFRNNAR